MRFPAARSRLAPSFQRWECLLLVLALQFPPGSPWVLGALQQHPALVLLSCRGTSCHLSLFEQGSEPGEALGLCRFAQSPNQSPDTLGSLNSWDTTVPRAEVPVPR